MVGIDIGRHTVTVADLSGLTRASNTQGVTAQMSARHRLTATRRAVRSAPSRANLTEADVVAAGVGSPGPIDAATGVVGICHVLSGWTGQPLSQHVTDLLGCQVAVEKDANLAAIAEIWRGAAPERRNAVSLTAGEHPGAAPIMNGQPIHGNPGCADDLYFWGEWNHTYSHIPKLYQPAAMRSGNPDAAEAVQRFAAGAIWTLSTISSLLGPERIIISGMPTTSPSPSSTPGKTCTTSSRPTTQPSYTPHTGGPTGNPRRHALDLAEQQLIPTNT